MVVSEFKHMAEGMAKGDFAQTATNGALLTFYAAQLGNGGITKLAVDSNAHGARNIAAASALNSVASNTTNGGSL